jgi:hypothetical protein
MLIFFINNTFDVLFFSSYSVTEPDNKTSELEKNRSSGDQGTLLYSQLEVIGTIVSIAIAAVFYFHQQAKQRQEAIQRSSGSILREIDENKKLLENQEYEKISYPIQDKSKNQNIVKYTNVYLDSEGYQSILHSGFFTYFSSNTQHKLTLLYGRIRSHNELITYTDHLQDLFFMNNDYSKESLDKWYKQIERYDLILTKWEEEIVVLLDEVKNLIKQEQPKK